MDDQGKKNISESPLASAIREAYRRGEGDEMLAPLLLADAAGQPLGRIRSGDEVIFYDIRGEREVEITQAFTDPAFSGFPREPDFKTSFTTMIEYRRGLEVRMAFPPEERLTDCLSQVVSRAGLRQVKVAEREKISHVTYFFNGKNSEMLPGEEREDIPSPEGLVNYNERPEMSVAAVARKLCEKFADPGISFILGNFANVDVVGHLEDEAAIIRAVEAVDQAVGEVVEAARRVGVTLLITADHGTVERWWYPNGAIDTGHTKSPVPFILLDPDLKSAPGVLVERGELTDVAPTVLSLMGIKIPEGMTGRPLLCNPMPTKPRRVALLILDGWGINDEEPAVNLIARSRTPVMTRLRAEYPFALLNAAGEAVGLPPGTVGNSEAGHLHLGAGRKIFSDRERINRAIKDGSFHNNEAFLRALRQAKAADKRLHLLGIVSFYSSHGSIEHLFALLETARRQGLGPEVFVHAILGRRGEQPESGALYVAQVEAKCSALGVGRVVSVMGRYYALDRERNWDRVARAFNALVQGEGIKVSV